MAVRKAKPVLSASVTPAIANIGGQPVAPVIPAVAQTLGQSMNDQPAVLPVTPTATQTPISKPTTAGGIAVQAQRDLNAQNAPVAPVAPVVAPVVTPTAPVVPQTLSQAMNDQPAPVAPTIAPVATTTQTAPKAEFMTDTQRRDKLGQIDQQASRDQMLANVGIMAKEDGSMLSNRDKFNAKTGYAGKPVEEQAILDTYFNANVPKTSQELKTQMMSGIEITDPSTLKTPEYRRAKFETESVRKYSNMSSAQLLTEMKNGIPSEVSSQLVNNPQYQQALGQFNEFKRIQTINNTASFMVGEAKAPVDPLAQLSQQLVSLYSQGGQAGSSVEAFKSYISQNPEIAGQTTEYNKQAGQLKEFSRARESLVADLKKKYAGEPLSTILAIAAREAEPINNQINSLSDSLSVLGADIKYKTDFATKEFELFQKDQEAAATKQSKLQELLSGLAISEYQTNRKEQFDMQKTEKSNAFDLYKEEVKNKYQDDRDANNYVREIQKLGVQNIFDLQKREGDQEFQMKLEGVKQKFQNSKSVQDLNNDITKIQFQNQLQNQGKALDLQNSMQMEEYKASLDPEKAVKWQDIADKATENSSLADLYGRNVGTYTGNRGYDLAGKMGDGIVAPPGARVISINSVDGTGTISQFNEGQGPMSKKDPGYGNSVLLQLADGSKMRLSHLQDITAGLGETLSGGQLVGTRGNTGNVLGKNGEKLTAEQLTAGRGAHVDVEITDSSGRLLSNNEQKAYLQNIKPFAKNTVQTSTAYTASDVSQFNSAKYNPQTDKDEARVKRYEAFIADKDRIQGDPNADTVTLMTLSRNQKDLGQAENKAYKDINTVVSQMASLNNSIDAYSKDSIFGDKLNPINGLIQNNNPWNTKAQEVQAKLQALVPKVARGVFGEVGVLTDADIANYMKTLPNIKQTADVQDVVQYALLDTLKNSLDSAISIDAGTYDISGLVGPYKKLDAKIKELKNKIEEKGEQNMSTIDSYNNTYAQ